MSEHNHEHHNHHNDEKPHIHSHRALIGFDKHGIPTIVAKADHQEELDKDPNVFIRDYMNAVAEYKKTFPSKQDVIEQTPDPAVKEMLLRTQQLGIDTAFDHFDRQKPQCSFGLAGICCKICNMGPCKITVKSPRGVCGADADLIVARNLLRAAAAGAAQHGMHAREIILSLKWASEGKLDIPIMGEQKIRATAEAFGIPTRHRTTKKIAVDLANVLLDDMSRTEPNEYQTIKACAPSERQEVWKNLDILPISAYHEVFEAYHKTGCAIDGDWKSIMQQFLRCGLAFTFSGVVGANIATDSLFGVGDRVTSKVNIGALKKGYVNIANTIKIAYLPITHSLAVLETADELSEQTGLNVELVKYGSWNELMDALNSGRVDGASVLIELAMKSKEQGIGLKAVALGHKDGNVLIASDNIKDARELKGKTIAIPHRQSSHNILLNDALVSVGLTIDDVNITELTPTEMPSALAGGQIDGYCVAEPFGAKAVSLGVGRVLFTSEELWEDSLCCGLVLTDKFIEKRENDAKIFVESYKQAGKNLTKEKALETAEKYLSQEKEVLELSLQWISYDNLDITEEDYAVLTEKIKSYGLSDNPPSYEDFVKNNFD